MKKNILTRSTSFLIAFTLVVPTLLSGLSASRADQGRPAASAAQEPAPAARSAGFRASKLSPDLERVAAEPDADDAPVLGTYCATKAAMISLSQALRGDLSDSGVRVITVLPSTLDTDMSRGFDGPKMDADEAAVEILDAIRLEEAERAIGPAARELMAALAADPLGVEQAFAKFRA